VAYVYVATGVASIVSWTACAVKSLTYHPDATLEAICGFRHNALTIGQALAFPVPLAFAVIVALSKLSLALGGVPGSNFSVGDESSLSRTTFRRLNLGFAVCSLWLGASAAYMPAFSCGYQLYEPYFRVVTSAVHFTTALFCLGIWSRNTRDQNCVARLIRGVIGSIMNLMPRTVSDDPSTAEGSDGRNEYALCTLLFGWFAVMPVVSPFPRATVPSILGRRLSRAASGWTLLAAVTSYAIKDSIEKDICGGSDDRAMFTTLRQGLAFGSAAHLFIIALKLIGVDGGGLILPGNGLWQVYPMALAVPFTAILSCIMHFVSMFANKRLKS